MRTIRGGGVIINSVESIKNACLEHGAKAVYDAAHGRMSGDHKALPIVDLLNSKTLDDANHIAATAFDMMGPVDRATDAASAVIGLAKNP
jgi:hypothetical protein